MYDRIMQTLHQIISEGQTLLIDFYNCNWRYTDICPTVTASGNTCVNRCGTYLVVEDERNN